MFDVCMTRFRHLWVWHIYTSSNPSADVLTMSPLYQGYEQRSNNTLTSWDNGMYITACRNKVRIVKQRMHQFVQFQSCTIHPERYCSSLDIGLQGSLSQQCTPTWAHAESTTGIIKTDACCWTTQLNKQLYGSYVLEEGESACKRCSTSVAAQNIA